MRRFLCKLFGGHHWVPDKWLQQTSVLDRRFVMYTERCSRCPAERLQFSESTLALASLLNLKPGLL